MVAGMVDDMVRPHGDVGDGRGSRVAPGGAAAVPDRNIPVWRGGREPVGCNVNHVAVGVVVGLLSPISPTTLPIACPGLVGKSPQGMKSLLQSPSPLNEKPNLNPVGAAGCPKPGAQIAAVPYVHAWRTATVPKIVEL